MSEEEYRDYDEGSGRATGCALGVTLSILIAILIGAAVMLAGCKTVERAPVEVVKIEYKDKIKEVHTTDSVTDTRFVYVKGDTVIDYRDRIKWRDRYIHDSLYIERHDSIPVPYPVEKPLTKWEQAKMDFGGMAIGAVAGFVCFVAAWLIKKFRK